MLIVKNLTKINKGKIILQDVSFEIPRGKIAIFLGESGVGKSLLLWVLNNLETYDSGCFFLDNHPLNIAEANTRHIVGMVFQYFNLFENLTVEANITLALMRTKKKSAAEAKDIAQQLLERYGIQMHAHATVQSLSGGQKQRLAIARTLALNPQIVCFDEPTSALDPRLTGQVASVISELAADQRVVLLATHDVSLLPQLDAELFLLHQGTIAERAPSKEYYQAPDRYPRIRAFLAGS